MAKSGAKFAPINGYFLYGYLQSGYGAYVHRRINTETIFLLTSDRYT
jgi:hypothetical protein